jgi:hypothetical protein
VNSYWRWLFFGSQHDKSVKAGILRLCDRWILLHLLVGVILYLNATEKFIDVAKSVVLPLVAALIGMTFAWAGNLNSILNSNEIQELASFKEGGFEEYVFIFQTSLLLVLTSASLWFGAAIGLFTSELSKYMLYCLLSATIRESWHFVLGVHYLLISKNNINSLIKKQQSIKKRQDDNMT